MYEVFLNNDKGLCEIYQDVDMKFAFCEVEEGDKTSVRQLHPWIKCRDFLGDALFASHHGVSYSVYGFSWDGKDRKVPTDMTYLLIKHESKEELNNNLRLVHSLEKEAGWRQTELIDLDINADGHVFLLISSKKWVSSTVLISLYTMLWRLASNKIKEGEDIESFLARCEKGGGNDATYLKRIREKMKEMKLKEHVFFTIMKNSSSIFEDAYSYAGNEDLPYTVHDNNGILTIVEKAADFLSGKASTGHFGDKYTKVLADLVKEKPCVTF